MRKTIAFLNTIVFLALAGAITALPLLAQQGNHREKVQETGLQETGCKAQETSGEETSGEETSRKETSRKETGQNSKSKIQNLEVLPSRHLATQVKINGKGPFRLILDTGSPLTFLSNQAAQRAGLITAETAQPTLFGMRGQVTAKTLDVGGAQVSDFSLLVLDHPVIEALSEIEGPIDGILGFTFFARYKTVIDYTAKTVTLTPGTYRPDDLLTSLMGRLMKGEGSKRVISSAALWGMEVAHTDTLPGVVVTKVYPQSAASQAGLRAGDRILLLDGRWTDTQEDCFEAAAQIPAGQNTLLQVKRGGKTVSIHIQPRSGL